MNTFNKNCGNPDSAKIIQHLLEIVYIEEKDQGYNKIQIGLG
jgi:hypothetical protein